MLLPPLAPERAREIVARVSGVNVLVDRRRHGRQVHRRPRDAHFAGSTRPGRRVRPRHVSHGRRGQRREQRRRARRPCHARRCHRTRRGSRDTDRGLSRSGHRSLVRRRPWPSAQRRRRASSRIETSRSRGSTTRAMPRSVARSRIASSPRSGSTRRAVQRSSCRTT